MNHKYTLYIINFIFLLFFISCSLHNDLGNPKRYGYIDGIFGDENSEIVLNMYPYDSVIDIDINYIHTADVNNSGSSIEDIHFKEGSYYVSNNNFRAIANETWLHSYKHITVIKNYFNYSGDPYDVKRIEFKIEMEGFLLWHNSERGEGEYTLECKVIMNDGSIYTRIFKDDWIIKD